MAKDYYEVLGVTAVATSDEIKKAYRRLAVLYHPDRNPDPKVAQHFKEITEAYNTLSDEENRRRYDLRFSTAFGEAFSKEPEVKHRDPGYRKRSRNSNSQDDNSKWTMKELIMVGVVYTRYCCYAGVLIVFFLAVDYLLPSREHTTQVSDIYSVKFRKGTAYSVVKTTSGKGIKMYRNAGCFKVGEPIAVQVTWIYSLPLNATNPSGKSELQECAQVRMGYIFRSQIFFPIVLLISSLLGLIRQVGMETNFNFGIVAGLFVLINAYLIFSA